MKNKIIDTLLVLTLSFSALGETIPDYWKVDMISSGVCDLLIASAGARRIPMNDIDEGLTRRLARLAFHHRQSDPTDQKSATAAFTYRATREMMTGLIVLDNHTMDLMYFVASTAEGLKLRVIPKIPLWHLEGPQFVDVLIPPGILQFLRADGDPIEEDIPGVDLLTHVALDRLIQRKAEILRRWLGHNRSELGIVEIRASSKPGATSVIPILELRYSTKDLPRAYLLVMSRGVEIVALKKDGRLIASHRGYISHAELSRHISFTGRASSRDLIRALSNTGIFKRATASALPSWMSSFLASGE